MKVLLVTPYITCPAHPAFMRNKTGFGYMVHDMASHIGEDAQVDVFAVNSMAPAMRLGTFNVLKNNWAQFFSSFSMKQFRAALEFIKKYPVPLSTKLRTIYQFCALSRFRKTVTGYDLVHIHGCTPITAATIDVCRDMAVPFLVTLHGLVSFTDEVRLHDSLKQYERDFLKDAADNDYHVNFISTGNKETAEQFINRLSKNEL
ncbi:MAG: glycosyltransferase [Bacteroidales bacterium]|nr:glycosyltransferase [Bacteroidales bacterium]